MNAQPAPEVQSLPQAPREEIAVTVDEASHVATVEVRRGPHNFFDLDSLIDLADAIEELASGPTRAIVLCSEGKNFSAGADFSGANGSVQQRDGRPHLYDVAIRLFEQPLPIVAAVQGAAIGGGAGLALAADFRVASPSSRFAVNFSVLGFHPGFGMSVTLPFVVGHQAAMDLMYTGRRIDGTEAHRIGLCDDLVPEDRLRERAHEMAAQIAAAAPLATRSIRQTLRGHLPEQIRAVLVRERAEQERLMATEDFAEGVAATRDRRPARFTGR